jgi:choice-of-anchor C domain-containing protein
MKALTAVCSALLLASVPTGAAPLPRRMASTANLVVNGSFEDGLESEVSRPLDKGSTAVKGWFVTRGQIDVTQESGKVWKAAHGKRALDLHGSPGFGGVEQTIATRPGRKYRVTFRMSGNPGVDHQKVQLGVRAAGQNGVFELTMKGRTYEDLKWAEQAWEFTARQKATVLELHTAMPATANGLGGPLLDDVKVVEVN